MLDRIAANVRRMGGIGADVRSSSEHCGV
jgi:hypothetical protein